jgi:CheY-like chemotaxis protein
LGGPPRFSSQNRRRLDLARILLVHGELAPRLALQTILQAGGYAVDVASTPAEALSKLDESVYDLVLSDAEFAVGQGGTDLLAYARIKDYRPATAIINSHDGGGIPASARNRQHVSIHTENLPSLLEQVADLIGMRLQTWRRAELACASVYKPRKKLSTAPRSASE